MGISGATIGESAIGHYRGVGALASAFKFVHVSRKARPLLLRDKTLHHAMLQDGLTAAWGPQSRDAAGASRVEWRPLPKLLHHFKRAT